MSILGTRVLRTEDPKFLTTGGEYTEDLVDDRLAGAVHVFFVRSPLAHARITGIDLNAARGTPGGVTVRPPASEVVVSHTFTVSLAACAEGARATAAMQSRGTAAAATQRRPVIANR